MKLTYAECRIIIGGISKCLKLTFIISAFNIILKNRVTMLPRYRLRYGITIAALERRDTKSPISNKGEIDSNDVPAVSVFDILFILFFLTLTA